MVTSYGMTNELGTVKLGKDNDSIMAARSKIT